MTPLVFSSPRFPLFFLVSLNFPLFSWVSSSLSLSCLLSFLYLHLLVGHVHNASLSATFQIYWSNYYFWLFILFFLNVANIRFQCKHSCELTRQITIKKTSHPDLCHTEVNTEDTEMKCLWLESMSSESQKLVGMIVVNTSPKDSHPCRMVTNELLLFWFSHSNNPDLYLGKDRFWKWPWWDRFHVFCAVHYIMKRKHLTHMRT